MGLNVRLNGRAERDLQDIIDQRAQEHGVLVAERVHNELIDGMQRLALRPFLLGRRTATPDVRVMSLTRYPYRIFYTVTHSSRLDPDLSDLGR